MKSETLRTGLAVLLCTPEASRAWVASSSSPAKKPSSLQDASTKPRSQQSIRIDSAGLQNSARFYQKYSKFITDEAVMAAAKVLVPEPTPSTEASHDEFSTIRKLPWMEEAGPDAEESNNAFLDHWNWQFSFFEENLTNLRVREVDHPDESIHDLYYATKGGECDDSTGKTRKRQRVYTISLESDEYRDVRMTYMHCPGMQTFRCLSYPRNGDLPIMGMGIMKMGGVRNLAILDYQPLPPTDEAEIKINDVYTSELLKLRQEIPSMSQAMTHRHFDSTEERKYFTEFPLLGRCNEMEATEAEAEGYQRDLLEAQKKYVAKHAELTQAFGKRSDSTNNAKEDADYVLERHSDFDTHVSETEPAGPFLCGVFGPEKGGKLVHNVIFPLSQHGMNGKGK